jgi:hypothetical protein
LQALQGEGVSLKTLCQIWLVFVSFLVGAVVFRYEGGTTLKAFCLLGVGCLMFYLTVAAIFYLREF